MTVEEGPAGRTPVEALRELSRMAHTALQDPHSTRALWASRVAEVADGALAQDGFEPSEFANVAADAGMKAIIDWLAAHGAEARHIFIVLDLEPDSTPDAEAENATMAGHGYEGPEELFEELLDHARQVGESLGIQVNVVTAPHRVGGQG
jgi:hypothetical protein